MRVTYVGHATVLIEDSGSAIVTDPLLRRRVGHLRRQGELPAPLPQLDGVLISHLHRDHLDTPSLKRIADGTPAVLPASGVSAMRRTRLQPLPIAHWLSSGRNAEPLADVASPCSDEVRLNLRLIPYSDELWLLVARDVSKLMRLEHMRRDVIDRFRIGREVMTVGAVELQIDKTRRDDVFRRVRALAQPRNHAARNRELARAQHTIGKEHLTGEAQRIHARAFPSSESRATRAAPTAASTSGTSGRAAGTDAASAQRSASR